MSKWGISLLLILITNLVFAAKSSHTKSSTSDYSINKFGSYSVGHNLSTNGQTLDKGQWSVGSLYFGHGIDDNLTVGTSIFALHTFTMFNVMGRYGIDLTKNSRLSFDVAYFKTFGGTTTEAKDEDCHYDARYDGWVCYPAQDEVTHGFHMEAINFKATYSQQVRSYYRANTTLSYYYYWDERMPFSFRMDPANGDPYTINLSSLHEFRLHKKLFINYEIGLWGFNYQYPYIHTGLTVNFQAKRWLFGFGGSTTFSPSFPKHLAKEFVGYDSTASYHPELEFQFFF